MRQAILTLAFFAAPFAAYALYQIARREAGRRLVWDRAPVLWLGVAGCVCVVAGIIAIALMQGGPVGYQPPLFEPAP